ncbi:uncharacterized protein CLAFUR5_00404 [Fulvia fulva]|uniref:Uncharacterized protein n=1 Tax=Passalora fulva TaxID=5499 RepID=A0A9Q8P458_PASFU|nr:uncharacterized protein CLAFUR5_00404 [Fulvia fulva]UJO12628.1 hypothetical protein CLAFUR5_00404 [Fulvia fulva]
MTAWETTLRCMSIRSDLLDLPLASSASETSEIIYMRGTITLCSTKDANSGLAVIGRISGGPVLVFETFEPDTTVELAPGHDNLDCDQYHHPLPASTASARHFAHLRSGDTISYNAYGLKLAIHMQRTPLDITPDKDTQSQTPSESSSMAAFGADQVQAVNTSYETIATQPLSQPLVEDSETDVDEDDLDMPAPPPAPALPTPDTAGVNSRTAESGTIEPDTGVESEPESPSNSPLQKKQQSQEQAPRKSDDDTAARTQDRMLLAMATPSSSLKTYGKSKTRDASHTPSMRDGEAGSLRGGPEINPRHGMKRKTATRPDVYDVEDDQPVKKRKGWLPKAALPDEDTAVVPSNDITDADSTEDEIVVAPLKPRKTAPASNTISTPTKQDRPTKVLFSG